MKLFMVQYDGMRYYIEAASMQAAIDVWHGHVSKLWGVDYEGNEEPEQCAMVHDEAVIRGQ